MEDATFKKKSIAAIYKLRDAKQDEIEASFGGPSFFAKMLSRLRSKLSTPSFQAAIEDIDNASGTVKSWKSRPVPRDTPIHDLEFD